MEKKKQTRAGQWSVGPGYDMINGGNVLFEHCQTLSQKSVIGKFVPSSEVGLRANNEAQAMARGKGVGEVGRREGI